jgi:predicted DNA-binding transcriptional regulator YafY
MKADNDIQRRCRQLVRTFKLLTILRRGRRDYNVAELAAFLHVTTRTVRRDLIALLEAGLPIINSEEVGYGGTWRALPRGQCPICEAHEEGAWSQAS